MQTRSDQPIARWALAGAGLGAAIVLVTAVLVILLTGMELMAVAGLSAGFGGTGFGAMLGAVLATVREPNLQVVPLRESGI